jgi:hypothetical protein
MKLSEYSYSVDACLALIAPDLGARPDFDERVNAMQAGTTPYDLAKKFIEQAHAKAGGMILIVKPLDPSH